MVNKKICIAIPQDLYDFISAQRLIPEEPFHKVIRRLIPAADPIPEIKWQTETNTSS